MSEKATKKAEKGKGKRKEASTPNHTMETRTRKKARETFDFVTNTVQRQESQINLLGEDYAGPSDDELKMIFRVFDRDNDGKIGSEEIAAVLKSMGKRPLTKKIQKMLDECDPGQKGYIERDGFIKYMKNKAAKKAESLGKGEKGKEKEEEKEKEKEGEKEKEKEKEKEEAKTPPKKGKGKGKAAAKGKKAAAEKKEDTKGKGKEAVSAPLQKTSSILNYYNVHAGLQGNSEAPLDEYKNPKGAEYDLGQDYAFAEFSVLVGLFFQLDTKNLLEALTTKGFKVKVVTTEREFIDELATGTHTQAWIIPTTTATAGIMDEFIAAVMKFHAAGGGLLLWGDNTPYFAQSNLVLKKMFAGAELDGNDSAQKILSLGDSKTNQQFAPHLITSGINHLYEGHSICHFKNVPVEFDVLATSSHGQAVILYADSPKFASPKAGRVMVDCGFTKLYVQWDTAGTARYVKNAAIWLLGLENRLAANAPIATIVDTTAQTAAQPEKHLWQYKHGGWHNYDEEASKVVEEAYQDWLKNPYIDIRAVKSGSWSYSIDFKQMLQTNIQHQAHTQREVRRVTEKTI